MKNICIVYNFAQLYREPIFRLIDCEWNCEWWFGKNTTDIKGMNPDALRKPRFVDNKHIFGPMQWQSGVGRLMRRKDLDTYIILGEPMVLSTWWNLIQRRIFYRNKRVILWTHGWYGREDFAKKWLKRIFFGMADHVLTYGQYAKDVAISQGFNPDKITPIHNSLDHSKQVKLRNMLEKKSIYLEHFGNNYPVLFFVGRLTPVKRLDMLVDAVKILDSKGEKYNVVFIGDGEKRVELEQKVKNLGLTDRVWFYGGCYDDTRNAQLIYEADLCVAPGNIGLTAMHTMVFGTPVLTHDDFKWQMPEFEAIQPGKTGAFYKYGSIKSLAESISEWFSRPDYSRDAIRQACYKEIDEYWTPEYQLEILKKINSYSN